MRSIFPVPLKGAILPVISQENMQRFPICWFIAGQSLTLFTTICAHSCIGAVYGSGPGALSVRHFFVQYCVKGIAVCYKKLIVVADIICHSVRDASLLLSSLYSSETEIF